MKPPKPTKYKHGDKHESTGRIFLGYLFRKGEWMECFYTSTSKKQVQIEIILRGSKARAKKNNLPCNLTMEYLQTIITDKCPIFGIELSWGSMGSGISGNSPTLDRILPDLGYVEGNVCIISHLANLIKQNVGYRELYQVADWLYEKTREVERNVKANTAAPVSTRDHIQGELYPELGSFSATWAGEDGDDSQHHCGTIQRQDTDHRAQAGSGDGMGRGGQEVGAPKTLEGFKDYWESREKTRRVVG